MAKRGRKPRAVGVRANLRDQGEPPIVEAEAVGEVSKSDGTESGAKAEVAAAADWKGAVDAEVQRAEVSGQKVADEVMAWAEGVMDVPASAAADVETAASIGEQEVQAPDSKPPVQSKGSVPPVAADDATPKPRRGRPSNADRVAELESKLAAAMEQLSEMAGQMEKVSRLAESASSRAVDQPVPKGLDVAQLAELFARAIKEESGGRLKIRPVDEQHRKDYPDIDMKEEVARANRRMQVRGHLPGPWRKIGEDSFRCICMQCRNYMEIRIRRKLANDPYAESEGRKVQYTQHYGLAWKFQCIQLAAPQAQFEMVNTTGHSREDMEELAGG